ncbi:hypothetical protein EYF80_053783 [Liparis tanakae]|uniref:Uncharacterized protein n=1 Tax=Liparis tanakae TaxID=230148 RepID=A0A4Z2F4M2_9TELE|nr:hypothetical protein EYF80_053783 [Liparis tanakae]
MTAEEEEEEEEELLGGGHDLDVLKGAVCRVVVGVAAGDACAVAHGDRADFGLISDDKRPLQCVFLPMLKYVTSKPCSMDSSNII